MAVGNSGDALDGDGRFNPEPRAKPFRTSKVLQFADFELRVDTKELHRKGSRIKLQVKPFQLLETLLENQGELVTREQLRNKLWPAGTFVDFESGLNTAINRLRKALEDSAETPRYIETLPRLGYRFICPLEDRPETVLDGKPATGQAGDPTKSQHIQAGLAFTSSLLAKLRLAARFDRRALTSLGAVSCFAILALLVGIPQVRAPRRGADFRPLNFRARNIINARFLPDARVVYSARVNGDRRTFVSSLDGSGSYTLPGSGVIASVSHRGDLAIFSRAPAKPGHPLQLSRSFLSGKQAEVLADDVWVADWSPDSTRLALVRESGSESVLEYPAGNVIYRSQGWINCIRVSPSGLELAFLEHPIRDDDAGHVRVTDAHGRTTLLTRDWSSAEGLAWNPSTNQVWFTASKTGLTRSLYGLSRSGEIAKLSNEPLSLRLLDISQKGRALLAIDDLRMTMKAALAVGKTESDLSQFNFSHIDDISQDGNLLLFTEDADWTGSHYSAYVYDQTSHTAKRFGSGRGLTLSPDGKRALTVDPQDRTVLTLTNLASGKAVTLPGTGFRYQWARFFGPEKLIVGGSYPGQPLTICYQTLRDGKLESVPGAPYLDYVAVSPDLTKIAGWLSEKTEIFDLSTRTVRQVMPECQTMPMVWGADSKDLFLLSASQPTYSILKLNIGTYHSSSWKTLLPENLEAFMGFASVVAAPKADAYAYSAHQSMSRLFVVDGLA